MPKEHDARIAVELLDAAEQLVDAGGLAALSVRAVADRADTTTRAVYSLFGSKSGLVAALGNRTFELLEAGVAAVPATDDPAADLVRTGVEVLRSLAVNRPALYQIGVQQTSIDLATVSQFIPAARSALAVLQTHFVRLAHTHGLGGRTPEQATAHFHAMCEGLAALELRGMFAGQVPEQNWRDALGVVLRGLSFP